MTISSGHSIFHKIFSLKLSLSFYVLSILLILNLSNNVFADTYGSSHRTSEYKLKSEALNEIRNIYVRTPPNYDPENKRYPVVYVLDGESNFEYAASYLDYMSDNDIYPDMIVTGVRNVNRNRDYVPRFDANYPDTGKADNFLKFVKDEWIPAVNKHYATTNNRVLLGHSFGGVFTLHTLFSNPALFDAYIALSTSAWVADEILFEEARKYFSNPVDSDAFVYMAVGEGDGGPTKPSSEKLAKLFEKSAPNTLNWTFDITPQTDHFKNFSSGIHDAFMALYPAWQYQQEVIASAKKDGEKGIEVWFEKKSKKLGNHFYPSWFDLGVAAFALVREGQQNAALVLMEKLKQYHPDNAHIANFSASVFEMTGNNANAMKEYKRTLELVNKNNLHPNSLHKSRVEEAIKRIKKQD